MNNKYATICKSDGLYFSNHHYATIAMVNVISANKMQAGLVKFNPRWPPYIRIFLKFSRR
jgi:hypothetical protein